MFGEFVNDFEHFVEGILSADCLASAFPIQEKPLFHYLASDFNIH